MRTQDATPARAPLYARVLRLRHVRVGGFASFALFECVIALGVLLALAELVSWWAVPALPAAVACMVKVNDLVIASTQPPAVPSGGPGGQHAVGQHTAARAEARSAPPLRRAVEDEAGRVGEGTGRRVRQSVPPVDERLNARPPVDERPPAEVFRITVPVRGAAREREIQTEQRSAARHAQRGADDAARYEGQRSLRDDDGMRTRGTLNQGRFA